MTTTATDTAYGPTAAVDYTTFDADNHYYEATDAYTRISTGQWPSAPCNGQRSMVGNDSLSAAR